MPSFAIGPWHSRNHQRKVPKRKAKYRHGAPAFRFSLAAPAIHNGGGRRAASRSLASLQIFRYVFCIRSSMEGHFSSSFFPKQRTHPKAVQPRFHRRLGDRKLAFLVSNCAALVPVRKAKFAEIEKFERKKNGARAGARHVSWGIVPASRTYPGRSVGRSGRPTSPVGRCSSLRN